MHLAYEEQREKTGEIDGLQEAWSFKISQKDAYYLSSLRIDQVR